MAGMPMQNQDQDAWRTPQFRQKVIKSIEDAMLSSGNPLSQIKSPNDMENQVFQKAKSRDEYLGLIAKLILYVRESNTKLNFNSTMYRDMMWWPGGPFFDTKKQGGMGQGMVPGMQMGGPSHMGMPGQDPLNALTNLTKQNMGPGQPGQMPPGVQGMMGGHPGMGPQRPQFQQYQQMGGPGGMPGGMPPRGMGPGSLQGMRPDMYSQMAGQQGMNTAMQGPPQGMQAPPQMVMPPTAVSQNMSQPGTMGGQSMAPAHSPAMLPSPTGVVGPSVPRGQMDRGQMGAPSPNAPLNTLGNPTNPPSVGSAPSPANRNPEEEKMYLEKLKQLQKYVEPLKRMINKIETDDERKKDHMKMKNLLEILTDPKKRLPIETLTKCQQVLEKLDLEFQKTSLPTTVPGQHMCQNLLDKIASQAKMPMFNHTLKRTFGPALEALHGVPIKPPSPPPKKPKTDSDSKKNGVSDLLQGEIARLNPRFNVNLDPLYHMQSKTLHLVCKLEDKNLPSVPPIAITVPENYPETSPTCDTESVQYQSTPFLQKVQKNLSTHLVNMPSHFSITALLNLWEMSVRKASVGTSVSI